LDEAAIRMAAKGWIIREDEVSVVADPDDRYYARITAKCSLIAKNFKTGQEATLNTVIGSKRQAKFMKLRDGRSMPDTFWYEKGTTKALRNAKAKLVPEEIKAEIISAAKKATNRVEEIKKEEVEAYGAGVDAAPAEVDVPAPAGARNTNGAQESRPDDDQPTKYGRCSVLDCHEPLTAKVAAYSKKKYGRLFCFEHQKEQQ
jgi:hypothetical protein